MLRVQISGDRVLLVNLVDYHYITESVECMDRGEALYKVRMGY